MCVGDILCVLVGGSVVFGEGGGREGVVVESVVVVTVWFWLSFPLLS